MKTLEELQVGKWYQDTSWYSKKDYAKFEKVEIGGVWDQLWHSENISDGNYTKRDNFWHFTISTLREVPLEEIQEFLPEGHPDKFTTKNTELIELPEKWYFKVTHDNYEKFKDIRSLSKVYGYISSNPVYNLSWGLIYSDPPFGHTEISFEAFEKHVLSKEKSRIISSKPEKTWNPKFKVGDKVRIPLSKNGNLWYKNNISELYDYHKDYFIINGVRSHDNIGLNRDDTKVFRENSFCESDLVLYTEPTKEEWIPKVGDWVVVKSYSQAKQGNGITKDNLVSKLYIPGFDNASGMLLKEAAFSVKQDKRFCNILKSHIIRKAEPWEIPIEEETTTISTVGVPSGGIYISGRDPYDHYPSPKEIRDKYYLHRDLSISKPLTPKESFKTTKLPTKSWY